MSICDECVRECTQRNDFDVFTTCDLFEPREEEHVCKLAFKGSFKEYLRAIGDPVVRCRDCTQFMRDFFTDEGRPHFCAEHGVDLPDGEGFCAWAARTEVE